MPLWGGGGKWSETWAKISSKISSTLRADLGQRGRLESTRPRPLDPDTIYIDVRDPNAPPPCEFAEFMSAAIEYLQLLYGCSKHKYAEELLRRAQTWVRPHPEEGPYPSFDEEINDLMNVLDLRAQRNNLQPVSVTVDFANDYKIRISNLVHRRWNFDWRVGLPTGGRVSIRQKTPPYECLYPVESLSQIRVLPLKGRSRAKGAELCVHLRSKDESERLLCTVIVAWVPGNLDSLMPAPVPEPTPPPAVEEKEGSSSTVDSVGQMEETATTDGVTELSK